MSTSSSDKRLRLRLYVAGDAPNSVTAQANLKEILTTCEVPCDVEVVDVVRDPDRAIKDAVLITPTLLRVAPRPELRIIGNLAKRRQVRLTLGLGLD